MQWSWKCCPAHRICALGRTQRRTPQRGEVLRQHLRTRLVRVSPRVGAACVVSKTPHWERVTDVTWLLLRGSVHSQRRGRETESDAGRNPWTWMLEGMYAMEGGGVCACWPRTGERPWTQRTGGRRTAGEVDGRWAVVGCQWATPRCLSVRTCWQHWASMELARRAVCRLRGRWTRGVHQVQASSLQWAY